MTRKSFLTAVAAVCLVALAGCSGYPEKYQWTEAKVVTHGWLEARAMAVEPLYCYRTLSTPECFAWPQKGEERRLVGHYGPKPF